MGETSYGSQTSAMGDILKELCSNTMSTDYGRSRTLDGVAECEANVAGESARIVRLDFREALCHENRPAVGGAGGLEQVTEREPVASQESKQILKHGRSEKL